VQLPLLLCRSPIPLTVVYFKADTFITCPTETNVAAKMKELMSSGECPLCSAAGRPSSGLVLHATLHTTLLIPVITILALISEFSIRVLLSSELLIWWPCLSPARIAQSLLESQWRTTKACIG
jgi:hypothetical protein